MAMPRLWPRAAPSAAPLRRSLGVGIGLRRELYDALFRTPRELDWLEFIPENFVAQGGARKRVLERASERWPLLAHGVALNVGGPDPLDGDYLARLRALLARLDAPFFSDHLCFQVAHGHYFHDLLPLPFTEEAVVHVARRVREAAERLERPIALENITYYAEMPVGPPAAPRCTPLTEAEFIRAVLEESGAWLLLDVNNAYLNAVNHGRDPWSELRALPLERTVQIHLAGHARDFECDVLLDTHGAAVADPVWDLYEQVLDVVGPIPTLLEWDTNIPDLDRVLDEADRAKAYWRRSAELHAIRHEVANDAANAPVAVGFLQGVNDGA